MEKEQELLEKVKGAVSKGIDELTSNFAKSEEIEALKKELLAKTDSTDTESVKKNLEEIALKFEALKESGKIGLSSKGLKAMIEDNYEAMKKAVNDKVSYSFNVKADSIGTISPIDFTNHTEGQVVAPQYIGGIVRERRNPFNILSFVNFRRALSPIIYWVELINEEGNAQFIDECTLKPPVDFDLEAKSETAKKVAVSIKVCTEIMNDIPQLESVIRQHLRTLVFEEITKEVIAGTGGSGLNGISTIASAYTPTDLTGTVLTPNIHDAIEALYTTLSCMYCKPDYIFMNCADIFAMKVEKDADGRRLWPINVSNDELIISGVRIIENNYIPAGSFLIGDFNKLNVAMWEDIRVEMGFENDDFTKNMRTLICEARLLSWVSDIDSSCFIFDTFTNVISDITKS